MKTLTVKQLITTLLDEKMDATVAIENNGYPNTTTMVLAESYLQPNVFMKKSPRIQKEYLHKNEIKKSERDNYKEVLVLNAMISTDEAKLALEGEKK